MRGLHWPGDRAAGHFETELTRMRLAMFGVLELPHNSHRAPAEARRDCGLIDRVLTSNLAKRFKSAAELRLWANHDELSLRLPPAPPPMTKEQVAQLADLGRRRWPLPSVGTVDGHSPLVRKALARANSVGHGSHVLTPTRTRLATPAPSHATASMQSVFAHLISQHPAPRLPRR